MLSVEVREEENGFLFFSHLHLFSDEFVGETLCYHRVRAEVETTSLRSTMKPQVEFKKGKQCKYCKERACTCNTRGKGRPKPKKG